jgi:condensin complex subunit 3
MISQLSLPSSVLPYNLDVLRKLSDNERDLIRVVVEAVHEIRDSILEPDVNEDADGEQTDLEADTEEEDEEDDGEEGVELGGKASAKKARRPVKVVPELDEAARLKKAFVDLRGLEIMQALLERVNGVCRPSLSLSQSDLVEGALADVVLNVS